MTDCDLSPQDDVMVCDQAVITKDSRITASCQRVMSPNEQSHLLLKDKGKEEMHKKEANNLTGHSIPDDLP